MIDPENLPIPTFVNSLSLSGFLNGNVNLMFSVSSWYPKVDRGTDGERVVVAIDEKVLVDLRMDLHCAQALYDQLGTILEANTKPQVTN